MEAVHTSRGTRACARAPRHGELDGPGRGSTRRVPRGEALALALAIAAAWLPAAHVVHAQEEATAPAEYDSTIDAAVTEFQAGRWAEARALFARAQEIFPNARALRGVGMASFEMRDYPRAALALQAALLEERRALTDTQREQVASLLQRTRVFLTELIVPAAGEGAVLAVDGAPTQVQGEWPAEPGRLTVAAGPHAVVIRLPDGRSTSARIDTRGGGAPRELMIDMEPLTDRDEAQTAEDEVVLAPAARPTPPPVHAARAAGSDGTQTIGWAVLGSGLGVAVLGSVLLGVGAADTESVASAERGTEWSEVSGAYDRGPALSLAGGVILGVGLAAAAIGLLVALASEGPPAGARLSLLPNGVEVQW